MIHKVLFVCPKQNHHITCANNIIAGMKKHGISNFKIVPRFIPNKMKADLLVTWAWKPFQIGSRWQSIKKSNIPALIMERAYIGDRHKWVSLGYNGLNGNADFYNKSIINPSRWNKHFFSEMKLWNTNGEKVLVIGQCKHDAAVSHINMEKWYFEIISKLNKMNIQVIFRPHPLNKFKWQRDPRIKYRLDETKNLSFDNIKCVVTFNSNTGVLSTLAGIPTIAWDKGSMVYDLVKHNLDDLEYCPDRTKWSSQMAYTQWLPEEIHSGEAWEHLKEKFINE